MSGTRAAERRAASEQRTKEEARKVVTFLTSVKGANTTVPTKVFRQMLLDTEGWIMFGGRMYDITGKSLGAGVYRVTLEPRA